MSVFSLISLHTSAPIRSSASEGFPIKLAFTAAVLIATAASAQELVFPVITGTTNDRAFSTTLQVSNSSSQDVACSFSYSGPERVGKPLRSEETISAGQTKVHEDFLSEIAAAGTVRVSCSAEVEIVARVQDSLDGGKTFRDGRTYRPFPISNMLQVNESSMVKTRVDLVLAEVAGKSITVVVQAQDAQGKVFGRKTYDIPAHAQRVVNVDSVRDKLADLEVVISVTVGDRANAKHLNRLEPGTASSAR